jgi:hypothetical protein
MSWETKFWRPIKLKDGRTIATLADARMLIMELPPDHQSKRDWEHASELLSRASRSISAIDDALARVLRGLRVEGLV